MCKYRALFAMNCFPQTLQTKSPTILMQYVVFCCFLGDQLTQTDLLLPSDFVLRKWEIAYKMVPEILLMLPIFFGQKQTVCSWQPQQPEIESHQWCSNNFTEKETNCNDWSWMKFTKTFAPIMLYQNDWKRCCWWQVFWSIWRLFGGNKEVESSTTRKRAWVTDLNLLLMKCSHWMEYSILVHNW